MCLNLDNENENGGILILVIFAASICKSEVCVVMIYDMMLGFLDFGWLFW